MDPGSTVPATDLEALLKSRYPTFHALVEDARTSGDASRLAQFVERVRRESAAALATETNAKRRAEIENVLRATEAAAALAVQIAFPPDR